MGDLFVHRFSGSFAAEPLTLTEEVVEREDTTWVVDLSLSQREQVEGLRVRFDAFTGEPQSGARLDGTLKSPSSWATTRP